MPEPEPPPEPDSGAVYCSCCPERRPRGDRRGYALLCPVCDRPSTDPAPPLGPPLGGPSV